MHVDEFGNYDYHISMKTKDAVAHFGTKSALARALGISRQAVVQWGETVPELRAYQVQVITRGRLKAA